MMETKQTKWYFLIILYLIRCSVSQRYSLIKARRLEAGVAHCTCTDQAVWLMNTTDPVRVYYYPGATEGLQDSWLTVLLHLRAERLSVFTVYTGTSLDDVLQQVSASTNKLSIIGKDVYMRLSPFSTTFVAVVSSREFKLLLHEDRSSLSRIGVFFCSVVTLYLVQFFSTNVLFHYLLGTLIGIVLSIVVFIHPFFILVKFFSPEILTKMGSLLNPSILEQILTCVVFVYRKYPIFSLMSIVVVGLAIFIASNSYKLLTIDNPRRLAITKYLFQALSLVTVYLSCQMMLGPVLIIILTGVIYKMLLRRPPTPPTRIIGNISLTYLT